MARQWKQDTRDWQAAFDRSVRRRAADLLHVPFIGLSAGYDSAAVAAGLRAMGQRFLACTMGDENASLIDARVRHLAARLRGVCPSAQKLSESDN